MSDRSGTRVCTLKELEQHCTEKDCWLAVDGKVYDLTSFVSRHPGGRDFLLLGAGRDATQLVQTYHPFTKAPYEVLKKYYVADFVSDEVFNGPEKYRSFYSTVAERVDKYFRENKVDHKWSNELVLRAAVIYGSCIGGFALANLVDLGPWRWLFAAIHGLGQALFGLQIMHDSSHCSLTHKPWVWRWIGVSWDIVTGASFYSWLQQHTIGHHIFTNIRGMDPDIGDKHADQRELRRISRGQKFFSYYRLQHLYSGLLYPFLAIKYRIGDLSINTKLYNGPIRVNPSPFWFNTFVAGKLSFLLFRVGLPAVLSPLSTLDLLLTFLATELLTGAWLAFNFQVSHVAHELVFFDEEKKDYRACDWAVMQVVTSQDYSHGNRIWTYLCGALNYQIVHHLFPTVNQTHYAKIAPIVMKTCAEYGIPYKVQPGFFSAMKSHFGYLAHMSDPEHTGAEKYLKY
eukprot:RCo042881